MPFNALGLNPLLVRATRDIGYAEPTPIQSEAIPVILAGHDVIATAQTGTGKTAAFLLPILHRLLGSTAKSSGALIVTPTRELAQQIDDVCRGLARHTALKGCLIVGGAAMGPQEKALRAGVHLIVATPGRLLDHMRQGRVRVDHLHTLVLDEADRMLDMGFLPDMKRIVDRLPARKQTLLFSATMPPVIAGLARDILRHPVSVQVGRHSLPAVGITQAVYPVAEHLKTALVRHLLRNMEMPSVLLFTRTKHSAKRLAKTIAADGFAVTELHGNRSQSQRTKAMEGFRRGDFQVMVATNIAARGLDVEHITHVISYDVPDVPDDYVHRVGRTARAQAEGDAFLLVCPAEEPSLTDIERQIGQRLPRVSLPDFDYSRPGPVKPGKAARSTREQRSSETPRRPHQPAQVHKSCSHGAKESRTHHPGKLPRQSRRRRHR
jgi:ATP-dependent RNA helicase RhlE